MFGYGTPIGSHFAPLNPAYVDLTGLSAHDPEKAKALLAEAGVSGLRPTLVLPPPSYARRGGEIVASQLRAVGIEPQIVDDLRLDPDRAQLRGHDLTAAPRIGRRRQRSTAASGR